MIRKIVAISILIVVLIILAKLGWLEPVFIAFRGLIELFSKIGYMMG